MSLIISADLSLNSSGFCIIDKEKGSPVHYESITSDKEGLERLNYNYHRYLNLLTTYREIEYIAYEIQTSQMRFSYSAGSILPLAENMGVWKLAIYKSLSNFTNPPLILGVPAQDIKIYATGNGGASKDDMINAVNGHHIKSMRRSVPEHSVNDCADAYHLAKYVRNLLSEDSYEKYIISDYRLKNFSKIL